jgi:hypothetical protein
MARDLFSGRELVGIREAFLDPAFGGGFAQWSETESPFSSVVLPQQTSPLGILRRVESTHGSLMQRTSTDLGNAQTRGWVTEM